MILAVLAWRRRPRPREIRAVITPDGITLKKDGFSYGARWADASLVRESRSAYLMRFNQLYMRLPKRGFSTATRTRFSARSRWSPCQGAPTGCGCEMLKRMNGGAFRTRICRVKPCFWALFRCKSPLA